MGLYTNGNWYDIPEGIVYSFPVKVLPGGTVQVVEGLEISDFAREKMDATAKELLEERELATQFLEGAGSEGKL